jgi:hypothetical protein
MVEILTPGWPTFIFHDGATSFPLYCLLLKIPPSSFYCAHPFGTFPVYNLDVSTLTTCTREFTAKSARRQSPLRLPISGKPRRSSKLLGAQLPIAREVYRRKCGKRHQRPRNAPRGRIMNTDENSASESDETRSDDDL